MTRPTTRTAKLGLHALEAREVPATAVLSNGILTVTGDGTSETIVVRQTPSAITVDGLSNSFPPSLVASIKVDAKGGNDAVDLRKAGAVVSKPASVVGGTGNDTIRGGTGADHLNGGNGNDEVSGGAGADSLFGGYGNDALDGGDGHDHLDGGRNNDVLVGGDGNDVLTGFSGNDVLFGNDGNDRLDGGGGEDVLWGGANRDTLYGGPQKDFLSGDGGDDGLFGGTGDGADNLLGGTGDDRFLVPASAAGALQDVVLDKSSGDARIVFKNSGALSGKKFTGQGDTEFSFAAGSWTNAQVERVDVSLANLHRHTGNTRLLKTAGGEEMSFLAVGKQTDDNSFRVGGWNGGSVIAFVDPAAKSDMSMNRLVYHEFGHNWDQASENLFVPAFRVVSGWVELDGPAAGYTASAGIGDDWYYKTSKADTFARNYGKTNPLEDMATTWEAYFVNEYHGGADALAEQNLTRNDDKWDILDAMFVFVG